MAQQLFLPIIPHGATEISNLVCVVRDDNQWTYFLGTYPIYSHTPGDLCSFRYFTSQMVNSGACSIGNVITTFGTSKSSVIRSLGKLRLFGPEVFFKPTVRKRRGNRLTPEILEKAQKYLYEGRDGHEIADTLEVPYDTLRKAFKDGRLKKPEKLENGQRSLPIATSKSLRDVTDAQAADGMGTACTRVEDRILASFGACDGAVIRFEPCLDVPKGAVLCALPALLANGLLDGIERLESQVKGYYRGFHILILLAFMTLCRIKTVERFRDYAPGEFGKIMGLDRAPEARCLRKKMDDLCADKAPEAWAAHLAKLWMDADPDAAGTLYIDGHTRVYHGTLTKLPKHYVSREKLCLRGSTDYWVNDALGRPFFVVEKVVDPGMLKTLRQDIVPRLLKEIPGQPTEIELTANPWVCRFVLVFDREGYSPGFFREMWINHRIACITYHKHPKEPWPQDEFTEQQVRMPNGEIVNLLLAERGSLIGSDKDTVWVREVRKLTNSGHQTAIISTAFELQHINLAARMFSRWCQENFFRYMMQHFAFELLFEYGTEVIPDTEQVVNPAWRTLDRSRNALQNKLRYRQARFAEISIHPADEGNKDRYDKWLQKKGDLLEEIQHHEHQLDELKAKLKETPKHISWAQLEEKDKFNRLIPGRRQLMDTVRMIVYRAETAMAKLITGPKVDFAEARSLLQALFEMDADIQPDLENKCIHVYVHGASRPSANRILTQLFMQLNEAQVIYPGTDMRLVYALRSAEPSERGKNENGVR